METRKDGEIGEDMAMSPRTIGTMQIAGGSSFGHNIDLMSQAYVRNRYSEIDIEDETTITNNSNKDGPLPIYLKFEDVEFKVRNSKASSNTVKAMVSKVYSHVLHEMAEAELKLSEHQKKLTEIEAKIREIQPLHKKFMELKQQLELKSYDLKLFQGRAQQNEHHKLGELVKRIEQELQEANTAAKEKKLLHEDCVNKVLLLEKSIKEHDNSREGRLKDLEKKIKETKALLQSASKDLKGHENEKEKLIMEKDVVLKELASLETQLSSLRAQIDGLISEVEEQKEKVNSTRNRHDHAKSQLDTIRMKMRECDSQINGIESDQQRLQDKLRETNLERKRMENEVKRMEMEQKDCSTKVDKLIERHAWITSEKQLFGKTGTDYDFAMRDPGNAREELEKLQGD